MKWYVGLIVLGIVSLGMVIGGSFAVIQPVQYQYNKLFGSHVIMAYDQASFEGMLAQVNLIWIQMNNTFQGADFATTYNDWWYLGQTYDNSLLATNDYFNSLTERLNATIIEKERIVSGNQTIMIPYNQWYQTTLDGFRTEMQRQGGLDWVIRPSFVLRNYPIAYFWEWFLGIYGIIAILMCLAILKQLREIGWD